MKRNMEIDIAIYEPPFLRHMLVASVYLLRGFYIFPRERAHLGLSVSLHQKKDSVPRLKSLLKSVLFSHVPLFFLGRGLLKSLS